jgi:hypothetical protein
MIGRCVLRSCTPEGSRSNPRTDHRFANVCFLAAHSHSRRDWADRMRPSALSLYVTAPDDCPRMIVGVGDNQLLKKARQCLSSAAQRIRRMLSSEKFALICTPEQALGEDVWIVLTDADRTDWSVGKRRNAVRTQIASIAHNQMTLLTTHSRHGNVGPPLESGACRGSSHRLH